MTNAITLTEPVARADAWDTACRQMRKAGRNAWSREDANAACDRLAHLMAYVNPELAARYARDLAAA